MPKSWPLCNGAESNLADSFGLSRKEQLYCFARQRGAKRACASKIVFPTWADLVRSFIAML